jgi:hypothetical protein
MSMALGITTYCAILDASLLNTHYGQRETSNGNEHFGWKVCNE